MGMFSDQSFSAKAAKKPEPASNQISSSVGKPSTFSVDGRCMMTSGDEYSCTARSITLEGANILVQAPSAAIDATVICYLDNIGLLRGTIRGVYKEGFRLEFLMNEVRKTRVMTRIKWHESRASESAEQRAAPRIVPNQRSTEVRLGDTLVIKAEIIDLSMSGIAVTTAGAVQPFVGSIVQVGKRFATVVRLIDGGFAAEFKLPFNQETFNQYVTMEWAPRDGRDQAAGLTVNRVC